MDSVWGNWYNLIFNSLVGVFGQAWLVIAIFIIVAILLGNVLNIDIRVNLIITSLLSLALLMSQGLFSGVLGFVVTLAILFTVWFALKKIINS